MRTDYNSHVDEYSRRLSENRRAYCGKADFGPFFRLNFVKYSKYSPHLIEKMDSKPLSLATASILGQHPRHWIPNVSDSNVIVIVDYHCEGQLPVKVLAE